MTGGEGPASGEPARWAAVVAMASNRVIGRDGGLPWHLPEDLRWFKKLTSGRPVVMGRRTWESLRRALPGRRNIVLSRSLEPPAAEGAELVGSVEELDRLALSGPVFVIGGAEVYRQLLPRCDEVYLSYVFAEHEGDTYFPAFEQGFGDPETLVRFDAFEIRRYRRPGGAAAGPPPTTYSA